MLKAKGYNAEAQRTQRKKKQKGRRKGDPSIAKAAIEGSDI
jgi:hypothetical protein